MVWKNYFLLEGWGPIQKLMRISRIQKWPPPDSLVTLWNPPYLIFISPSIVFCDAFKKSWIRGADIAKYKKMSNISSIQKVSSTFSRCRSKGVDRRIEDLVESILWFRVKNEKNFLRGLWGKLIGRVIKSMGKNCPE